MSWLAPVVGGVAGLLGSGSGSQTTTQTVDPATQAYMQQLRGAAMAAAGLGGQQAQNPYANDHSMRGRMMSGIWQQQNPGYGSSASGPAAAPIPGVDPLTTQAAQGYQNASQAGNLGLGALGGDMASFQKLMNPYQSQVLDQMNNQWGRLSSNVTNTLNDQATHAGAFGGARQGIALGQGLGDLANNQAQQMAGLQYQGYNDAMNQATQLANLGMGANGAMAGLGDYARQVAMSQDPAMRRIQILQQGMGGPTGGSTTQSGSGNPFSGLLGGVATGAGIASQLGWKPFGQGT